MAKRRTRARSLGALPNVTFTAKPRVRKMDLHADIYRGTSAGNKCTMLAEKKVKGRTRAPNLDKCPVQLVFKSGRPHLRFCVKPKSDGHLVPVTDGVSANTIARKVCACWRDNNKSFDRCVPKGAQLGKAKSRRKRKR